MMPSGSTPSLTSEGQGESASDGEGIVENGSAAMQEIVGRAGCFPRSKCNNSEVPLSATSVETNPRL